jgi:hypothetical protein
MLKLTRVQLGRGLVDPSTDIREFTELVDGVQYNDIDSANTLVRYQTTISFKVRGSDIIKTFKWSELGIFARLNDGEEFLFTYAYSSNPDILVEGSEVVDRYIFGLKFENSNNVTVELHVDQTVPLHAATYLSDSVDPIPTVTSVRAGLVPVGLNDPGLVLVASDPPHWRPVPLADRTTPGGIPPLDGYAKHYLSGNGRWYRTTPFIMRDTTLYVDPANSDRWPNFSTLAKALEYLNGENISAGVTVTVELADGTHKIEDVIKFDHPQAQQVRIVGASPRQQISFTELKEDGDDIILKASSVKGLSVGMSVIIQCGGQYWNWHPGGHTIKHIEYPHVRVSRSLLNQPPWWNEYKGLSANLFFYKTKVDCLKGGLVLINGIGNLSRMSMHGNQVPNINPNYTMPRCDHTIYTTGTSDFSNLIVTNFCRGIVSRYSTVRYGFVCAHGCGDGIIADFGSIYETRDNVYCNGNSGHGLWFNRSGGQSGQTGFSHGKITYLKGNNSGLISTSSADIDLSSAVIQYNTQGTYTSGGRINLGSPAFADEPSSPVWVKDNSWFDLVAVLGGYIYGVASGGYLGSCSPPNRQFGNDGSFIAIDNN